MELPSVAVQYISPPVEECKSIITREWIAAPRHGSGVGSAVLCGPLSPKAQSVRRLLRTLPACIDIIALFPFGSIMGATMYGAGLALTFFRLLEKHLGTLEC